MIEIIGKGVLAGLLLSVLLGPAFFLLLETSISKGVKRALLLDLGIFFSDLFYLLIAFVITDQINSILETEKHLFQWIGGGVFIVFGLMSFKKRKEKKVKEAKKNIFQKDGQTRGWIQVIKGFTLNTVNPSVLIYWIAIASSSGYETQSEAVVFSIAILVTFFSLDFVKIIGARKLRKVMTPKLMIRLNQFTGSILVVSGLALALSTFFA